VRYELDYEYSDELVRRALKRSALGSIGWPIALGVLLAIVWAVCAGDAWGYLCGLLQGALIVIVLFFLMIRMTAVEDALRFARKLPTRAARCVFTDESMTNENALARSELKWPVIQKVARRRDVWLFFLGRGQVMALPAEKINAQIGAFIESRVSAAGGKLQ
jgi:hypothetical protein